MTVAPHQGGCFWLGGLGVGVDGGQAAGLVLRLDGVGLVLSQVPVRNNVLMLRG